MLAADPLPPVAIVSLEQRWENLRKLAESSTAPAAVLDSFFAAYALYSVAHSAGADKDPKWATAADVQEQALNAILAQYPPKPRAMSPLLVMLGLGLAAYTFTLWQDAKRLRHMY